MLNLLATAVADGRFTTLLNALARAGIVDTLSGSGPFTLFAPTDQAFGALPDQALPNWRQPDQLPALTDVLTRHIIAANLPANTLYDGQLLQTIHGQILTIYRHNAVLRVDGTPVQPTELRAANGVIHVLDAVLQPV